MSRLSRLIRTAAIGLLATAATACKTSEPKQRGKKEQRGSGEASPTATPLASLSPQPLPSPSGDIAKLNGTTRVDGFWHTFLETGIGDGAPCGVFPPKKDPQTGQPRSTDTNFWVPDGPPRAYVDPSGKTRLIIPHYQAHALVGSSLEDVGSYPDSMTYEQGLAYVKARNLNCNDVIAESDQEGDPAQFNDATWPWAPYILDSGRAIVLNHEEYHPQAHGRACNGAACWYSAITFGVAADGIHFTRPPMPQRLVARAATDFEGTQGVGLGYGDHSNIARSPDGKYFYTVALRHDPKVRNCMFRTTNVEDPSSWRAWNGQGYAAVVAKGEDCVDFTTPYGSFASGSLSYSTFLHRFVFIAFGDATSSGQGQGFFLFLANNDELTSWSAPTYVLEAPVPWGMNPSIKGRQTWAYVSLLDPHPEIAGKNFDRIGEKPYLYFGYGAGRRKATRVPLRFVLNQPAIRTRGQMLYRIGANQFFYSNGISQYCVVTDLAHLRRLGFADPPENLMDYSDHGDMQLQSANGGRCN